MRFFKMTDTDNLGEGPYVVLDEAHAKGELGAILDGCDVGASYTFEVVEMTQAEHDALAEFKGF